MHYKNGREAKVGDRVVSRDYMGNPISGVVVKTTPAATSCNLYIVPAINPLLITASEALHMDDVLPEPQPNKA